MIRRLVSVLAAGAALAAPARAQTVLPPAPQPSYEYEARRIIDGLNATGMVAGVMVDGKVVYTGAFGKLEEGGTRPVTTDTLFPIASLSKAFTSTALAILVDRKQIGWDDPVRKYIPEFAMYDPWVSEHFTIRDALTHRSGLPLGAGDLLFWPDGNAGVPDVIKALPNLRPTTGFRDGYAYDNLLYLIAGEVIARVSGKSFQDFVDAEILKPVGLTRCAVDASRIRPGQQVATGHEREAGAKKGTPIDKRMTFTPAVAAAGGLNCPVGDMMIWARFWLDGGVTANGTRLISEAQKNELWKGVTPTSSGVIPKTGPARNLEMYALGWAVESLEGAPVITHSGGAPGVATNFILLPQQNVAIFASSNDYMATANAWTRQIADHLVNGKQDVDVIDRVIKRNTEANAKAAGLVAQAIRPPKGAARPSLPLSAYTGVYHDAWYGDVTITQKRGKLFIDMGRSTLLDGPLTPFEGDTFAALWPDRTMKADAFVTFTVESGKATGMKMKAISELTDFSYDFHDLDLKRK
ncbi:CubicO group peptidase (beta-lactamase class C family) [Novosphingobium kunmingense]|uniref:CubicO group peptidase (Beta-lactamase class C family) n=1 Tax=Novosphingobium kunmingense TaxID=1211806 RepID=A0A2N0I3R5_9SPHN|nr:serine hydrolase [Novosphingobium kunmingense]PKB25827.1 CubicO group peptidase (beta-lactamase class C family) [Novosphingobium kunmingense]